MNNGDKAYIGERFVGLVVGENPERTTSVVTVKDNDFRSFHKHQIRIVSAPIVTTNQVEG